MAGFRLAASLVLALCAQTIGALPAQAQQQADDSVVVTGRQTEEAIREFVSEMAVASRSENQLARWDLRVCPGMVGFRADYTRLVLDQIARRAQDIGLGVGEPGCKANILIIVSKEPDAVAQGLFDNYKRRLGYFYESNWNALGRTALKAFVASDAPVRWWHVSSTLSGDGIQPDDKGAARATGLSISIPSIVVRGPSLIKRATRQDLALAILVVDGGRLKGLSLSAIADYLAMASLAQLDPEADVSGNPSILNLFTSETGGVSSPAAMTAWDVAYLEGLYGATRQAASAGVQRGQIAQSMRKELTSPQ